MLFLNQNPFVRIFIPFVSGIFLSTVFNHFWVISLICILLLIIYGLFVIWPEIFQLYSNRWIPGILIVLFFMSFGVLYASVRNSESQDKSYISELTSEQLTITAKITDDVDIKENSVKTIVRTEAIISNNTTEILNKKILVYFHKDSLSQTLRYGDRIIFSAYLQQPDSGMNPEEFDYRKHLSNQGIYFTTWIGNKKFKIIERDAGNILIAKSIQLRNKILNILKSQLGESTEFQVAAAIVTGYRTSLDSDLRQAFSNSGAMHVMCVSGLHVGIIFLVLGYILKFLSDKKTFQRILKVIIILIFIWFYAMLTGFSASVLRATTMFSFVAMGMLVSRKIPVYNSLAASALFLLLLNPGYIYQVGFQLSYLAVIGIVALFPYVQKIIPAKGKFSSKIRDLAAVSIAAQIATTPISLYYFSQFPNYFLLTNIIVVPLAGLIIYTAIPAILLHSVPVIGNALSALLGYEMKLMNGTVNFVDQLPGSVSDYVFISFAQMLLLYMSIILLFHGFINKQKLLIRFGLLTGMAFTVLGSIHTITKMHHQDFIYPHNSGKTIIIAYQGKCTVISEDTTSDFQEKFKWKFKKYLTANQIDEIVFLPRDSVVTTNHFNFHFPVLVYNHSAMMFWDDSWKTDPSTSTAFQPDFIIFENNPFLRFEDINVQFNTPFCVFTTNTKRNTVNVWEKLLKKHENKFVNIYKSGAFILSENKIK